MYILEMVPLLLLVELVIMTHYTSKALINIHPAVIMRSPGQELTIECNSSSSNTTVRWTLPNNTERYSAGRRYIVESVTVYDSGVYGCSIGGESATTNVFIC